MAYKTKQQTLVIIKPDVVQRHLVGKVVSRFEDKGLKIVAFKMVRLSDVLLNKHYAHHKDKPFFDGLKQFMKSSPVILMILEGMEVIEVVRTLTGPTIGRKAPAGTIRGDFSMSTQTNIVHTSDSEKTAKEEIKRFFKPSEITSYDLCSYDFLYGSEERD